MGIPQHWRVRKQRYALVGQVCNQCGARQFPPRATCPACSQAADEPFSFEPDGVDYPAPLTISLPLATEYLSLTPWRWSQRGREAAALPQALSATQAS